MKHGSSEQRGDADVISDGQSAGDTTCSEEVLKPLTKRMFHYFLKHTHDELVAEDLIGKTLLAYFENLKANKVDLHKSIERYLWGIARHVLIDYWRFTYREERYQVRVDEDVGDPSDEFKPLELAIDLERQLEWIRCNAKLSDFQYKVYIMRADGLKNKAISTLLKSDGGRVAREYGRAKAKIHKAMKSNDVPG